MNRTELEKPNFLHRRPSIGTLLVCAVNLPLVVVLAVLLPMDYRREMDNAIAQKHRNLDEEALTIYLGLPYLAQEGLQESVQRYIDTVCARMQESRSPGHYIALRLHDKFLQAQTHRRASPEILLAMRHAASAGDGRATVGNQTLVVGTFSGNGVDVYVSEYTADIRRSIQREIFLHLAWLVALAFAAAAIVTVVLWSIVTRPVRRLSKAVSRIAFGEYEKGPSRFCSREMNGLSRVIQQMSQSLAVTERDRRAQMERARRIQENLLPNGVMVPGLYIERLFQPADEVAGDYYDLIGLPDDTWLICVADVAGHGVAAAMGSAMLKALVLHAAEQHREPARILQFVNQRLPGLLPDEFITMFLGRWHPERRRLDYASAGHEPGILLAASGETCELPATGMPLGIDRNSEWETEAIDLSDGQRMLLTTDGVAEASDLDGDLFGREQLAKIFVHFRNQALNKTLAKIRSAVLQHCADKQGIDDMTVLLLEVNADNSVVKEKVERSTEVVTGNTK